jgi:hypothetical protein
MTGADVARLKDAFVRLLVAVENEYLNDRGELKRPGHSEVYSAMVAARALMPTKKVTP